MIFILLRRTPPLPSFVINVPHCEFNQTVIDVDFVSQKFVNFPRFENSRSFEEDRLSEFPEIYPHEFSILYKANSDFDKAPMKKLKLGFDPLRVQS